MPSPSRATTPRPRTRSRASPTRSDALRAGPARPAPRPAQEGRSMALQGNLDDFSLPEILQLVAVQQKSGVLKLASGHGLAVIFFEGGRVVSTRDRRRNARDPLKVFLVQTGHITDPQLKQIETIEGESKRELTDVLLSGNYMTAETLALAIQDQIQDTMHQLLTWKQGTYHFSGDARTVPKFAANVRLNTEGLLMESMRRL